MMSIGPKCTHEEQRLLMLYNVKWCNWSKKKKENTPSQTIGLYMHWQGLNWQQLTRRGCEVMVESAIKMLTRCAAVMRKTMIFRQRTENRMDNSMTCSCLKLWCSPTLSTVYISGCPPLKGIIETEKVQKRTSKMIKGSGYFPSKNLPLYNTRHWGTRWAVDSVLLHTCN